MATRLTQRERAAEADYTRRELRFRENVIRQIEDDDANRAFLARMLQ